MNLFKSAKVAPIEDEKYYTYEFKDFIVVNSNSEPLFQARTFVPSLILDSPIDRKKFQSKRNKARKSYRRAMIDSQHIEIHRNWYLDLVSWYYNRNGRPFNAEVEWHFLLNATPL